MRKYIKQFIKSIFYYFAFDEAKYISKAFKALPGNSTALGYIDVGAAGGLEPRWKSVENLIDYTGFEPDKRTYDSLMEQHTKSTIDSRNIFQTALWDSTQTLEINMCSKPQVSSHFTPNRKFLDRFPYSDRFDVKYRTTMECVALDDLEITANDFIKIDVQGGELAVLKGAAKTLSRTLGLEVEVEFISLYDEQPLFGEISAFLTKYDFEFIDFTTIGRWERQSFNGYGQAVYGDALFLKSPETVIRKHHTIEEISNYLKILLVYYRFDMIDFIISKLSDDKKNIYNLFCENIMPIRKRLNMARQCSLWCTRVMHFIGLNYRSHLLQ